MRYFDAFSGIGGFSLGIKQAIPSAECVGYSEIDKYAQQIYQKHFPNHTNYGDITKIDADSLPDFDLLVGGFPCQAFSIAGKRGGFKDTRGTLFFDLARILQAKKPRLFLFENVKGLLSHDGGKSFATIIQTLDELGYDCQWQVLNSKNHGVPQNRERVFIIGHIRGESRPEVFPFGESIKNSNFSNKEESGICTPPITTQGGKNCRGMFIQQLNKPKHSNDRVYGVDGLSPTLNTAQGGRRQPLIFNVIRSRRRFSPHGSKQNWDSYEVLDKIRRLTPIECERLQGFSDRYTEGLSDTQRYKTLGNAVTVNVVRDIIVKLLNQ